ncbi:MAG: ABC transporter substrate-binding protein [Candidatus Omnitrophica bacterium]|nr:ABC transporter substrate-binding protein [Candidatus Omnitrophota bacterium]
MAKESRRYKLLIAVMVLASVMVWLFGFFGTIHLLSYTRIHKGDKLRHVNIAFPEWAGYAPLYLAKDKGFFKEEGLDVTLINEQVDSARRDAFIAGMLDFEAGTLDLLIAKKGLDAPITAVMIIDESLGSDGIVAVKEIKSLEDLIGKKVALTPEDVNELFLYYVLRERGLSPDKIIPVPRRSQHVTDDFLAGEADAVVAWEPFLSNALKKPGSHILATSADFPGVIVDTLNARNDLIKNEPQVVRGVMRAWFKAVKYYREHPAEASSIIAKYYGTSPERYREDIKGLKWVDYKEQADPIRYDNMAKMFGIISDRKLERGKILSSPALEETLDLSLLEGLYETGN